MKVGKFTVRSIETGRFGLDGGAMFGVVPKNLWSKAYSAGDEQNRIPMAARILLVEWEVELEKEVKKKKILIDTGNGNKLPEKLRAIYALDNSQYTLESELLKLNVKPEDITDVILTHLHFDHCGGSTSFPTGNLTGAHSFLVVRFVVRLGKSAGSTAGSRSALISPV